jgi:hypothetical protein
MELLLDNLFFLGQILSLFGIAWGAWMVLRESLTGIVFLRHKRSSLLTLLSSSLVNHFRRIARV